MLYADLISCFAYTFNFTQVSDFMPIIEMLTPPPPPTPHHTHTHLHFLLLKLFYQIDTFN